MNTAICGKKCDGFNEDIDLEVFAYARQMRIDPEVTDDPEVITRRATGLISPDKRSAVSSHLGILCADAVRHGYCPFNPSDFVPLPDVKNITSV